MRGLDRKLILLVEDEIITSKVVTAVLVKAGYRVFTVFNGEEAIAGIRENPDIDLVLMDIDLGSGIKGPEAALRILSYRSLPIVFHTSHSEEEYVSSVKNSGNFVLLSSIEMAFELFDAHRKTLTQEKHFESLLENPLGYAIYRLKCSSALDHPLVTHISPSLKDILDLTEEEIWQFKNWFNRIDLKDLTRVSEVFEYAKK